MRNIRSLVIVTALGLAAAACSQQGPQAARPTGPTDVGNMAYPAPNPAGSISTTTHP